MEYSYHRHTGIYHLYQDDYLKSWPGIWLDLTLSRWHQSSELRLWRWSLGYNNKNHRLRYSVQPESPKKSLGRNPESEGRRVSAFVIYEGVLVEQNTEQVWFLFLSRDFLNVYLHGVHSCFHIAIYLSFFTSNLLCLNVHLNYWISRQSLGIQATTMAMSCDNDITMGACDQTDFESCWSGQIRRDQNEWFNHYLGLIRSQFINIYFFMCAHSVQIIYVRQTETNFLFELGPFLREFHHSKNILRVSRVLTHKNTLVWGSDTQEPVVRKKAICWAKPITG